MPRIGTTGSKEVNTFLGFLINNAKLPSRKVEPVYSPIWFYPPQKFFFCPSVYANLIDEESSFTFESFSTVHMGRVISHLCFFFSKFSLRLFCPSLPSPLLLLSLSKMGFSRGATWPQLPSYVSSVMFPPLPILSDFPVRAEDDSCIGGTAP